MALQSMLLVSQCAHRLLNHAKRPWVVLTGLTYANKMSYMANRVPHLLPHLNALSMQLVRPLFVYVAET